MRKRGCMALRACVFDQESQTAYGLIMIAKMGSKKYERNRGETEVESAGKEEKDAALNLCVCVHMHAAKQHALASPTWADDTSSLYTAVFVHAVDTTTRAVATDTKHH